MIHTENPQINAIEKSVSWQHPYRESAKFIIEMLTAFKKELVNYCVLRNYKKLPYDHGNDIDILVPINSLNKVVLIANSVATKLAWMQVTIVRRYAYCGLHFLKVNDSYSHLVIDFISDCNWKGLSYASSGYILSSKISYKNFWVASNGCESAILLIKDLFASGRIKSKNNARQRICACANSGREDFVGCLKNTLGKDSAKWLLEQTENAKWKVIEECVMQLRWMILKRSFLQAPLGQFTIWAHFLGGHISHRFRQPLGFFLVVLGPDGSGKTTLANGISNWWKARFHRKLLNIHGDFGLLPRLRIIRKIWAKIRRRELPPEPDYTERHSGANAVPNSLIRSLGYLCYYYLEYLLGHFKIQFAKSKDRIIIADRYFYDYFFLRGNMKLPHWLLRFLCWFIPKPDMVVILDAKPEEIYRRKNELTVEEIERQQRIIHKISRWLPNCVTIKTHEGISRTVEHAKGTILAKMAEKTSEDTSHRFRYLKTHKRSG